jgi:hypothetical protein
MCDVVKDVKSGNFEAEERSGRKWLEFVENLYIETKVFLIKIG